MGFKQFDRSSPQNNKLDRPKILPVRLSSNHCGYLRLVESIKYTVFKRENLAHILQYNLLNKLVNTADQIITIEAAKIKSPSQSQQTKVRTTKQNAQSRDLEGAV